MTDRRLIDLTEQELYESISRIVADALTRVKHESTESATIVRGRKNIARALGISEDKLDKMVKEGTLKRAVKKNGRAMICDINKAFEDFNDIYNQ